MPSASPPNQEQPTKQEQPSLNMQFELFDNFSEDRNGALSEGVRLALKNRLYVPSLDYCLREELVEIRNRGEPEANVYRIALAKDVDTGKYVCCIFLKRDHIQSFTRKAYRKRGLGKATIRRLGSLPRDVYALGGVEGSATFWEKVGINAF